jgi:hypothetical protein
MWLHQRRGSNGYRNSYNIVRIKLFYIRFDRFHYGSTDDEYNDQ